MEGFFTVQETQAANIFKNGKKLSCYSCGLYKGDINYPKMQPYGKFKKGIMLIGEFTNAQDDMVGKPFQGREKSLYDTFKSFNIDIEKDCISLNAVMCHPQDKKTGKAQIPSKHEINCCRINIIRIIEQYKPKMIFLVGKIALASVMDVLWNDAINSIEQWRGFIIPDQKLQSWVVPIYNPSYVKVMKKPEIEITWLRDIENAIDTLENKTFPVYKEPIIHIIKDLSVLSTIKQHSTIAFDYETTGLKPHDKGHKILCASVAVSKDEVYSFLMPDKRSKLLPFINLLTNPYIKKMAHNIKFEDNWTWIMFKKRVKNWFWCSMQAAHILDNRKGVSNLKFQTYVTFGISGYNDSVKKWIQGIDDKNANSHNKMEEYMRLNSGKKDVLRYCALDSIFEYRLALLQQEMINNI